MKAVSRLILTLTCGFLIFSLLFFWLTAIVDSGFYWAFVQYIQTGRVHLWHPFDYARQTTISAPLYSVLLLGLSGLPGPDIILRVIQVISLTLTGYFVGLTVYIITAGRVKELY